MAILKKCAQCKREGRFAHSAEAKICAQCKNKKAKVQPREGNPDDDGENKSLQE